MAFFLDKIAFFSDMQDDLNAIQNNAQRAKYCSQRLLCRTLAGNNVYILTITSPASPVSPLQKLSNIGGHWENAKLLRAMYMSAILSLLFVMEWY